MLETSGLGELIRAQILHRKTGKPVYICNYINSSEERAMHAVCGVQSSVGGRKDFDGRRIDTSTVLTIGEDHVITKNSVYMQI